MASNTITKDLGIVTAYAEAVAGGYQGTRAQFQQLLANLANSYLNYNDLTNKPSINSIALTGNKTTSDLNISYNDLKDKPTISGGTTNYTELSNKPSINGVTLTGNKSLSDLGISSGGELDVTQTLILSDDTLEATSTGFDVKNPSLTITRYGKLCFLSGEVSASIQSAMTFQPGSLTSITFGTNHASIPSLSKGIYCDAGISGGSQKFLGKIFASSSYISSISSKNLGVRVRIGSHESISAAVSDVIGLYITVVYLTS